MRLLSSENGPAFFFFFFYLERIVINQALELYLEENMSLTSHGAEIHGMIFCFRMFCLSGFI